MTNVAKLRWRIISPLAGLLVLGVVLWLWGGGPVWGAIASPVPDSTYPWWFWVLTLLCLTFVMGIVAVLGGVGGGVLFVPIVGGFFPFNLDFVRCAGLLVALTGSLAAGPGLLRTGMADLRLALPVALIASIGAIFGAMLGLALPAHIIQTSLGALILCITAIMVMAKKSEYPVVKEMDAIARLLGIQGTYKDLATDQVISWKVHRTPLAFVTFIFIGIMAGMFGLGAGWANVPVLNLMMGAPLKVAVATSKFLLAITDTTAAWIYINNGAVLPLIVVPSIIGIIMGSWVGVGILARTRPTIIRYIVITVLLFAGLRSLLKGLGIWT